MIRDIVEFFKREKKYGALLLLVLAVIVWSHFNPDLKRAKQESPEVSQLRKSEEKLQKKIDKTGSIQDYLKQKQGPQFALLFNVVSVIILIIVGIGLYFDANVIFSRRFRTELYVPRPPPATLWKFSMVFKVCVEFIAISIFLSIAMAILQKIFLPSLSSNVLIIAHTAIVDFACVALIIRQVTKAGGTWRDLGLRIPANSTPLREILIGWGTYAGVIPIFGLVLGLLILLANLFHYEPPAHPLVEIFLEEEKRSPLLIAFSVILATVVGPILEEIFFRGFCYPAFKASFGVMPAMALSAAFFAIIHDNTFAFWPIYILGLALAFIKEKRGSLYPSIVLHVTHNVVFISYFFLAKKVLGLEA